MLGDQLVGHPYVCGMSSGENNLNNNISLVRAIADRDTNRKIQSHGKCWQVHDTEEKTILLFTILAKITYTMN